MSRVLLSVTSASFKEFWPDVVSCFSSDQFGSQVDFYIQRAEILLNKFGTYNESLEGFEDDFEMAGNLLIRRLIQADQHPASVGDAAGVQTESIRGIGYSMKSGRTLADLLGTEVISILSNLVSAEDVIALSTEVVFASPVIEIMDGGDIRKMFDPALDDLPLSPSFNVGLYD